MIEQAMDNGIRRRVEFVPAFDKRHPDPSKNYGIHGMELRFILIGPEGATQFVVYMNMHLPHVRKELFNKHNGQWQEYDLDAPMGADIGYHAKAQRYDFQDPTSGCPYTGGDCYYDGSGLQAEEFMPEFLAGGDDAVWAMLEQRYADLFSALSATEDA